MQKMILLVSPFIGDSCLAATLYPLNVKTGLSQVPMTSTINGPPAPNTNTYKSCVKKKIWTTTVYRPQGEVYLDRSEFDGQENDATGTCMPEGQKIVFNKHLEGLDSEDVKGRGNLRLTVRAAS